MDVKGKKQYGSITGVLIYLTQFSLHDIISAVNKPPRAMPKPSKAHMAAAKHVLRYLAGFVVFPNTYKQGGFELAT